jgi:AraC-like DNA-binding protein
VVHWDLPRTPTGALLAVRFGEDLGVPAEVSLRGTGLLVDRLGDPRLEVTPATELDVIRNILAAAGDEPGRGLEAGSRFTLSSYGIWGFALVTSPTLRSAVDVAFQFLDLTFAFSRIERRLAGDELRLAVTAPDVEPALRRFVVEREVAAIRVLERDLLGDRARPVAVTFGFPEAPAAVVERCTALFGTRPSFGARETVATLGAGLLDLPLPQANEVTMAMALEQCRELLDRRRARTGVSGKVRDLLLANLADPPDARQVAAALAMSDRTLRHRLAAEGTTFRALLDEVRERLAEELLVRGGLPVSEVALRLGYVEVSSFSQAFRRWKGVGPREYRARHGDGDLARA